MPVTPGDHYRPDHAGMGLYLHGPEAYGVVADAARAGADYVRATAPRKTGRYAASVGVQHSTGYDGRVAADVVADVEYADEVERRTHVLRRAAQMIEDPR